MTTVSRIALLLFFCIQLLLSPACRADNSPPVVTPGPAGPNAPSYTLRYKFVPGAALNYTMAMDTNTSISINGTAMPFNAHVDITSTQTVQSVNPTDGSAVLSTQIGTMTGTMNGQPLPTAALQSRIVHPVTMTITPIGAVDASALESQPGFSALSGSSLSRLGGIMPIQPVRVGDSWTVTLPMVALGVNVTAVLTLKAVTQVQGDNIAEIDSTYSSTSNAAVASSNAAASIVKGASMSGTSTFLLDIDKGVMDSTDIATSVIMNGPIAQSNTAPMPTQISMKMKMALAAPVSSTGTAPSTQPQ